MNEKEKLLDIQPTELKFLFEFSKRSSSTFSLSNKTDHYVAFKVKTTSPTRYSVRPNMGIVEPNVLCHVRVVREAELVAPAFMKRKDKFLIQSTIVPFGTTGEQIDHSLFNKDDGKYIDETKLRVVLATPVANGVENLSTSLMVTEDLKLLEPAELKQTQELDDVKATEAEEELKLTKDVMELKLQVRKMESKLNEVDAKIVNLREERSIAANQTLKQELAIQETDESRTEIQVGFSFLFICLVALIALEFGYHLGS